MRRIKKIKMSQENQTSRTEKVIRNSVVTIGCQMAYLIMGFITRTVFTLMLGAEYLGVSGLFSNILTILSFAELGIGSALVYRLYAPLVSQDKEKIKQFLLLYKKAYRIIIIIILAVGLLLAPIIPYIVEAPNVSENIIVLYVLYLLQTLTSYVFAYKKSILIADQKNYVVNIYTQIFNILMNLVQCIFLVLTHNFVIYCAWNIIFNMVNNVACAYRANKEYPYIKEQPREKLDGEEIKGLYKDVKGLMLTKVASTAFSGTDNIFISAFIGIRYVGILSNYTMLLSIINTFMNKVFDSVTASVGNLVVLKDKCKTETVLRKMFFLNISLYGYIFVGMVPLLREFVVDIWLSSEYDISQVVVMMAVIELLLRSIHYPIYITRNAMGSFSEYKGVFVIAAILNIVLDFLLVKPLGITGLFLATILCRGITYVVDIWVVYHMNLQQSVWKYFGMLFKWFTFLMVCIFVAEVSVHLIPENGVLVFVIKMLIISVEYFTMYIIVFGKTEEFRYYLEMGKRMIKKSR